MTDVDAAKVGRAEPDPFEPDPAEPGPLDVGRLEARRLEADPLAAESLVPGSTEPGPDDAAPSLRTQAAAGALWITAQKWVVRLSGFATIAVLTRLVAPTQFGVVAVATTVVPLVYLLSDLGFSTYLVQAAEAGKRALSTGFWFSVTAGTVLAVGLAAAAPLLAQLFHTPAATPVLQVMCVSVVLVALGTVPDALLRRSMQFRALAVQTVVAQVAAQVVAVAGALAGFGAWALVAQILVSQALVTTLAWWRTRWHPSWMFSTDDFKRMASFGTKVIGADFSMLAKNWGETAIVAHALGPAALGYLSIAQRLIQVTQDMSAAALVPVSTVLFSKIRVDRARLAEAYRRALGASYAAVAPVMTFIAVGAPAIVPLLFGRQWEPAVVAAQGLALAGVVTLGAMLDQGLFYGAGRPGSWLAYCVGVDAVTVLTTWFAVRWGLEGVAVGFCVVALLATVVRWFLVGRLLDLRLAVTATPFLSTAVAVLASGGAGLGVEHVLHGAPALVVLAGTGSAVLLVHLACVRVLMPGAYREIVGLGLSLLRRVRPAPVAAQA